MIKKFKITNYMGLPNLEAATGTVTLFSGQNGAGKTSALEAIKHVMSHDHDPRRIGPNGDFAEVTIWADNGDIYRMKTKKTGTTWDFRNAKGEPITKSDAYIKSMIDFLSLDPVEFIGFKQKEQVTAFLQAVPMVVTRKDLPPELPDDFIAGIDLNQHALAVIGDEKNGIYKRVYDERTLVTRIEKENRTAAQELDKSVLDVPDLATAEATVKDLSAKKADLDRNYMQAREGRINLQSTVEAQAEEARTKRERQFLAEYNRLLLAAEEYKGAAKSASDDAYSVDMAAANTMVRQMLADGEESLKPEIEKVSLDLGEATGKLREAHKAQGIFDMRDKSLQRAAEYGQRHEQYTTLLAALKALRTKLISDSPIPGLEVTDDGLLLNGIPFEITNLAQQLEVAIGIGQLRQKGQCGLMLIDNLEHFDPLHLDELLDALKEAAEKRGLQMFGAKVSPETELVITKVD